MTIFAAAIDLTDEQARLVRRTARLFGMELSEFLAIALESGIAHAQRIKSAELDEPEDEEWPWPGPDTPDAYLPF